jgi:hypothetical protein
MVDPAAYYEHLPRERHFFGDHGGDKSYLYIGSHLLLPLSFTCYICTGSYLLLPHAKNKMNKEEESHPES